MPVTTHIGGIIARYDPEVDALAVDFPGAGKGASTHQTRIDDQRAVDYDESGRPISVEILDASTGFSTDGLPHALEVRAAAEHLALPVFQTSAELHAHYGPQGPVQAAQDFLGFAATGRFLEAWAILDSEHRRTRAQVWLWNNREHPAVRSHDLESIVEDLAASPPRSELASDFARFEAQMYADSLVGHYDPITWGAASRPRPIGPSLEVVILVETKGDALLVTAPTLLENAIQLAMRHRGQAWYVAGFNGELLPSPGWPPFIR